MNQDIKQIIRQEYVKCASDPGHFMRKYCFIQHPQRGRISFNLYPFQEKVLHLWKDNSYSIVLKSRTVRYFNSRSRICFMVNDFPSR
jgi:hypothetical protein